MNYQVLPRLFMALRATGSVVWLVWTVCFIPLPLAAQPATFTTVSAASYRADGIAPESIVAGFGENLTTQTQAARDSDPNAPGVQLPTTLAGATVRVNNIAAPLFFVSPLQINYQIPANVSPGEVAIEVTTASGAKVTGALQVKQVAPAIFTANADGLGVPAALVLRVAANGAQTFETLAAFNQTANRVLATPIHLGPEGEKVFLILYVTGLRRTSDPNRDGNFNESVRVALNGLSAPPAYAGPAPGFVGLEQINVEIPRALLGSVTLDLQVIVDGFGVSNLVSLELAATALTNLTFRPLGLPGRPVRALATLGSHLFAATNQGVWGSSDNGVNWFEVSSGLPTNADVRTLFADGTTLYAGLFGLGGVYFSTDNGQSWAVLNNGLTGATLNINHLLLFNGRLHAATPGGVCRYLNGSWIDFNNGLSNINSLTLLVYNGRLLAGTRGGGIFLLNTNNSNPAWAALNEGLPNEPQVLTLASAGGALYAGLNGGGLYLSRNSGQTWTQVAGGFPANAIVNALQADGARRYVGANTGLYVSNDGGTTWNALNNGLTGCSSLNAVQSFAGRLLAGTTACGVVGAAFITGTTP